MNIISFHSICSIAFQSLLYVLHCADAVPLLGLLYNVLIIVTKLCQHLQVFNKQVLQVNMTYFGDVRSLWMIG